MGKNDREILKRAMIHGNAPPGNAGAGEPALNLKKENRMSLSPPRLSLVLITVAAALLFASLPIEVARAQTQKDPATYGIALMPFWLGGPTPEISREKKSVLDCTLEELCYLEGDPLENAAVIMTELTHGELKKQYPDKVVPLVKAEYAYTLTDKEKTDTLRSIAVRFGRQLEVEHVLAGTLWRYRERVGGAFGAETPASVGFALFLVSVEDGAILWSSTFDKTQTALTENLFDARLFFKTGMKWLTAGELATYGAGKLLENLPVK